MITITPSLFSGEWVGDGDGMNEVGRERGEGGMVICSALVSLAPSLPLPLSLSLPLSLYPVLSLSVSLSLDHPQGGG